ncbi:MAG: iron donor protein CyaY [Planctomycetota bacterium]
MTRDSNLDKQIADVLARLVRSVDQLDDDSLDVSVADGKVVLDFADGVKIIINRQGAANQIWVAEPKGGWHFDLKDGRWICDKRSVELFESVSKLLSDKLGRVVRL